MPTTVAGLASPTSHDLFILPFDHRGSFCRFLLGSQTRSVPNAKETHEISKYKEVIYDGFLKAVHLGVPKEKAGILVDEQFGSDILLDAKAKGFCTSMPVEKSGQNQFDFEYGSDFGSHIQKFQPTFVKVLVRYNPKEEGIKKESKTQDLQFSRLRVLADFCKTHHQPWMLELLIPPTPSQLSQANQETSRFDREQRPALMIEAIQEFQSTGIEPDLWKVEGIEGLSDCHQLAEQVSKAKNHAGIILLGRGEKGGLVQTWIATASHAAGFTGFAIGRTIFMESLKKLKDKVISRQLAVDQIALTYQSFCDLWTQERAKGNPS